MRVEPALKAPLQERVANVPRLREPRRRHEKPLVVQLTEVLPPERPKQERYLLVLRPEPVE